MSQTAYLQRPLPSALIIGTFFFVTLPLILLNRYQDATAILLIYAWLFGFTHFVLTLTVYLQSANLRYFSSNWKNRVLYYAIPAIIFVFFALYSAAGLGTRTIWKLVTFAMIVGPAVRLADFNHLNRQSFGVLQMLKGVSGCAFPKWMRRLESYYFFCLTLLLWAIFLGGGEFPTTTSIYQIMVYALAAVVGMFFLTLLLGFAMGWRRSQSLASSKPMAYFLAQSLSAGLAIYSMPLYISCLAIHYVEYHVLMYPRCFQSSLNPQSTLDSWYDWFRSRRIIFYLAVISLAGVALFFPVVGMAPVVTRWIEESGATPALAFFFVFDGLIVFHYFIEMLIWKFSDPYYRETLGPLYFPVRPKTA